MTLNQIDEILTLVNKKKSVRWLHTHSLYTLLVEETSFLPNEAKATQRLWHIYNNIKEVPKCKKCVQHNVLWNTTTGAYREYCSLKCAQNAPNVKEKKKQTMINRHGVEHNWNKGSVSREKQKQTMINRHGVEHNWNKGSVSREKQKQTMLSIYNCEVPLQSSVIQKRYKQTMIKNHGVEYPRQIHISKSSFEKINNYDWLYAEYNIKERSALDISNELGINNSTTLSHLRKFGFCIRKTQPHSLGCIQWLESTMKEQNIFIIHAQNIGEYRIPNTKYKVDGYCRETNTIYEFYGDFWHGNPEIYEPHMHNDVCHKTMGELHKRTILREKKIKQLGYNLVVEWENNFKQQGSF